MECKFNIYKYVILLTENYNIVAYLPRASTVEPEKQPLLGNISGLTSVSRKRLDKHIPMATNTHETIEIRLETVFSTRSVLRVYKEDN
jgi:hypothetical protein